MNTFAERENNTKDQSGHNSTGKQSAAVHNPVQTMADNSPMSKQTAQLQAMADQYSSRQTQAPFVQSGHSVTGPPISRPNPIQQMADNSPMVRQAAQLQAMADQSRVSHRAVVQREGDDDGPGTDERDKRSKVGDRHAIPHPYMDLGGWFKTLMTGRIADLYKTAPGFPGHALQVQQEITRLADCIDDGNFKGQPLTTALEYEQRVHDFIDKGADSVSFDLVKYIFTFSGSKTLKVERTGGVRKK